MTSITEQLKRRGSQGSKVVQCAACGGDIQPYSGRPVSLLGQFAHHPGQCPDHGERLARIGQSAKTDGTLFGWQCREVTPGSAKAEVCNAVGTDRAEFERHMTKVHGKVACTVPALPRLRKTAPAAKLPKLEVQPFKWFRWAEGETERRGQFWSEGSCPHSVWVATLDGPVRLVELHSHGDGTWSTDWSRAKYDRRDANRRAKRNAA